MGGPVALSSCLLYGQKYAAVNAFPRTYRALLPFSVTAPKDHFLCERSLCISVQRADVLHSHTLRFISPLRPQGVAPCSPAPCGPRWAPGHPAGRTAEWSLRTRGQPPMAAPDGVDRRIQRAPFRQETGQRRPGPTRSGHLCPCDGCPFPRRRPLRQQKGLRDPGVSAEDFFKIMQFPRHHTL